jgi:hypothetical protein
MPHETFERAALAAATVWGAVVLADHGGRPEGLEELREQAALDPEFSAVAEMVIQRKRPLFPHDRRAMATPGHTRRPGGIDVQVAWSMP